MTSTTQAGLPVQGRKAPDGAVPAFPGPATTAVCMIVAPVALAILCLLGSDIYKFHGHDFLSAMAAHHVRTQIFLNAVPIGIFMMMLAVVGLAGMAAVRQPRLARFGGAATLLGLCGPIFFVAIEFAGYQLSGPKYLSAGAYMYDQANMVPRISLNICGLGLLVGFITLAIAAYRAELLAKMPAILFGFTALLPIGFIGSVLPVSAVGFVACAVALVPLGRGLLARRPAIPQQVAPDLTANPASTAVETG